MSSHGCRGSARGRWGHLAADASSSSASHSSSDAKQGIAPRAGASATAASRVKECEPGRQTRAAAHRRHASVQWRHCCDRARGQLPFSKQYVFDPCIYPSWHERPLGAETGCPAAIPAQIRAHAISAQGATGKQSETLRKALTYLKNTRASCHRGRHRQPTARAVCDLSPRGGRARLQLHTKTS